MATDITRSYCTSAYTLDVKVPIFTVSTIQSYLTNCLKPHFDFYKRRVLNRTASRKSNVEAGNPEDIMRRKYQKMIGMNSSPSD